MSELNIYAKLLAITDEISTVAKNLQVGTGKSAYKAVGEADVLSAVKPIEKKWGIYSYPSVRRIVGTDILTKVSEWEGKVKETQNIFVRIETVYRFVNVDKPEEFIEITTYGDGVDPQDKAPGKAMTYADKYALLKAYKIMTGDDPDQNKSETGTFKSSQVSKTAQDVEDELKEKIIGKVEIAALEKALLRTGVKAMQITEKYGVEKIDFLSMQQWGAAMRKLDVTPDKKKLEL
jgi:hypothetical protein